MSVMLTCRVDSNCDDKVQHSHVRSPLSSVVLPTFNKQLMAKLRRKEALTTKEFSHMSRELGRDMKKILFIHTLKHYDIFGICTNLVKYFLSRLFRA